MELVVQWKYLDSIKFSCVALRTIPNEEQKNFLWCPNYQRKRGFCVC